MNTRIILAIVVTFVIHVQIVAQEWYQSKVIILDTWADLTPSPNPLQDRFDGEDPFLTDPKNQIQIALDNTKKIAVELYTDMIYGYRFEFTPKDNYRNIQESWTFTRIASISYDDPNLFDINREIFDNQLNVVYRYNLNKDQINWLESWESADALGSGGEGGVSILNKAEIDGKLESLKAAMKVAIRSRLVAGIPNKPLRVKGFVKLIEQPYLFEASGEYRAKIKVRLKINELVEQQAF